MSTDNEQQIAIKKLINTLSNPDFKSAVEDASDIEDDALVVDDEDTYIDCFFLLGKVANQYKDKLKKAHESGDIDKRAYTKLNFLKTNLFKEMDRLEEYL